MKMPFLVSLVSLVSLVLVEAGLVTWVVFFKISTSLRL